MDTRQFILEERKKGTPDRKIYEMLNNQQAKEQRGFAGEIIPTAGAIIGGLAGARGGTAGALAGSAAGGAAGEAVQQQIEKSYGQRSSFDVPQIAASGALSAIGEGAGRIIFGAAAPAIKATASAVREPMTKFLSKFSGYADDVVKKALERTPGAVATVRGGEPALADMIKRSASGVAKFAKDTLNETKAGIQAVAKMESLGGPGQTASRNLILQSAKDFVASTRKLLSSEHNIGSTKLGELVFDRLNKPSRIIAGGDRNTLQEAFKTMMSVTGNTSIPHIDAILEKLIALKTKTPAGTVTGPETKAVIGQMINEVTKFVETTYPKYHTLLKSSLPKRMLVNEAKDFFEGTANPTAHDISVIAKRLLQLYNTGNFAVKESVEKVGKEIGEDLTGGAAGALVKTGDQMSVRAPNLTTRGIVEKLVEFLPRQAVQNYIKTGQITGELMTNPAVNFISKTAKITTKAAIQEIANLLSSKTSN